MTTLADVVLADVVLNLTPQEQIRIAAAINSADKTLPREECRWLLMSYGGDPGWIDNPPDWLPALNYFIYAEHFMPAGPPLPIAPIRNKDGRLPDDKAWLEDFFEIPPLQGCEILALLGNLALALKHPDNTGPSAPIARRVAIRLLSLIFRFVDPELLQEFEIFNDEGANA